MPPEPQSILEHLFIFGDIPANVETGTYIPLLVLLSYVIASLGSFAGLRLATEIHKAKTNKLKALLHYGGAFAFGAGIWSMHFIGMLAYDMDMVHSYDPALTLLSMVIAVAIAYGVLQIMRAGTLKFSYISIGAVLLGTAICAMHYTGMAAMQMDADLRYIPWLFVLSVLIAVTASGAALLIVFMLGQHEGRWKIIWQIAAALIMGAAVCGMHYTGMAASVFIPYADCRYDPDQSFIGLAFSIAVITFILLGVAVLVGARAEEKYANKKQYNSFFGPYSAYFPAVIALVFGTCISLMGHYYIYNQQYHEVKEKFILATETYERDLYSTFESRIQALNSIKSFYSASNFVDQDEFHNFVSPLLKQELDIESIYYAPLIESKDLEKYVQEVSSEIDNYRIKSMSKHPVQQDLHVPVLYSEHSHHSHDLTGYDFASLQEFLKPMNVSKLNRKVSASFHVPDAMGHHNDQHNHIIVFQYIESAHDKGAEPRQKGYVVASVNLKNLHEIVLTDTNIKGIDFSFNKNEDALNTIKSPSLFHKNNLHVADKQYSALYTPKAGYFIRQKWPEYLVLIGGFFISCMISAYAFLLLRQQQKDVRSQQKLNKKILETARLNNQMQEYTDKLEEARLYQMDANEKLKKETETVKLLAKITNAVNEADDVENAIQICLNEICSFTGWLVGHVYLLDEANNTLAPSKIWFLKDSQKVTEFKKVTEETVFASGAGIPGKVFESAEPLWISDIAQELNSIRSQIAASMDIKSGLGFPVLIKKDVFAVLEFFAGNIEKPNEDLMNLMSSIGTQLGRIIERENIKKAQREAEKANQAKSEFLANMSHELRTPLNSIMGLSKMLAEDAEEKSEEQDMVKIVHKSASSLLGTVNDILDLSKIEAKQMILEKISFDFRKNVAANVEALAPLASSKGISLKYTYEKDNMPYLIGDPTRLSRILINLIGNAIKYTKHGQVEVIIDYSEQESDKIELICRVVDSGIGIPEDKLDLVFQKFSQADESTTRKYGGTGLGLAITRDLVEMMGGEIGVKSEVGKGSVFWFKIPFETSAILQDGFMEDNLDEDGEECAIHKIKAEDAVILIAEDYELNQVFIKKLMVRLGFVNFKIVNNGALAIEEYSGTAYDIILMDCHMPEKNGYEATNEIRKLEEKTDMNIPIIALTADAMVGARDKCIEAGMNDYISKPIDSDYFKKVLNQWFIFPDKKPKTTTKEEHNSSTDIIDFSILEEYAETDEEKQDLCNMFLEKTDESIKILKQQCTSGKNEEWGAIAHQMRGSAGMIGATHLASLCGEAEGMESVSKKEEREEKFKAIHAAYKDIKDILKKEIL